MKIPGPRTFRSKLLLALNAAIFVVLAAFTVWDYNIERNTHLSEKEAALEEEARTLLIAVLRLRGESTEAVQNYIDSVCAEMRETWSPGHHIAVFADRQVLEAVVHRHHSNEMLETLRHTPAIGQRLMRVGDREMVIGSASKNNVTVFVSEYLDNVQKIMHRQMLRRAITMLVVGVVLAIVLNVVFARLVVKPLNSLVAAVRSVGRGELGTQSPSFDVAELSFLGNEFNAMSSALAEADRARKLDMDKARRIQENLQPNLKTLDGVKLASLYLPATGIAGDYYDAFRLRDGTFMLCVADVTGHGVAAAMGAAMLKTLLMAAIETHQTYIADAVPSDPGEVLRSMNAEFYNISLDEDFASMILVQWQPTSETIRYASAGHEAAYLVRRAGELRRLEATGTLLGILEQGKWTSVEIAVRQGDRLFFPTDGITEAASPTGELFGKNRLVSILTKSRDQELEDVMKEIAASVECYRGAAAQRDDVTLLAAGF